MDDKTFHAWLISMFDDAEEASDKSRRKAERDIDYYDGKQWTDKEVKELKKRGQPAITQNLIRNKIDYLQGLERQQRTQPRALPRTPMHEQDAEGVTDSLRYVCEDQAFNKKKSRVWGDLLKAGWGGLEITVKLKKQSLQNSTAMTPPDYDVVVSRCNWDRMFWDPFSAEVDFSDASYLGLIDWTDRDKAIRTYGEGAAAVFDETVSAASAGETYDDKPKYNVWATAGHRKRIRIIQMYYIDEDGQWSYCEFTKGGILKDGPSPFMNEDEEREHPYCWQSAYVDRDNNRYGPIRDLLDPQDEINKRRSKALHHFTSRQTFGNHTFDANTKENKGQLQRPDGHVKLEGSAEFGKDFGIIPTNDQAAGHMELLADAKSSFEVMGPNAAMMGKQEGRQSGRAILAQQQGGQTQMGLITDALRELDFDAYRKIWNRVRQFWTGERWIRVTDDQRNMKWVGVNPAQQYDQQAIQQQNPGTQVSVMQQPIAQVDVDFVLDEAPAVGALMDEQFGLLVDLKQMDTEGAIPMKAVIAAAPNLRYKADLLKSIDEKEKQPPNPVAVAGQEAEVAQLRSKAMLNEAQARKALADAGAAGQPGEQPQGPSEIDVAQALAEIRYKNAGSGKLIAETEKLQVETSLAPQKMAHDASIARQKLNSGAGSNGQSAAGR
jgi:hypothetical protein